MTATEQLRQALKTHEGRCLVCVEKRHCAVAAGIAHDIRRALDEERRQENIAFPYESGYARLRRLRIEAALERRKGRP